MSACCEYCEAELNYDGSCSGCDLAACRKMLLEISNTWKVTEQQLAAMTAERDAAVASREADLVELSGPCFCDPVGSGEEFCHDTCMERQRADRAVALEGVLLEALKNVLRLHCSLRGECTHGFLRCIEAHEALANPSPAAEELLAKAAKVDTAMKLFNDNETALVVAEARTERYRTALDRILKECLWHPGTDNLWKVIARDALAESTPCPGPHESKYPGDFCHECGWTAEHAPALPADDYCEGFNPDCAHCAALDAAELTRFGLPTAEHPQ